ncbi:polysaccharide deacetylase family protein [Patescibacteria group bacterium]|nr:polysaccharide deacetylase family protein [Patescibacteria group bacterium]
MRKIIKKIFWYLVYFSGLNFIYNLFSGPRLILVGYHSVPAGPQDSQNYAMLAVAKEIFAKQISYLKNKYRIINFDDIARGTKEGIAIFFDDGFEDNFLIARPILKAREVRATVFLTTDLISQKDILWTIKLRYLKGASQETEKLIWRLKDLPLAQRQRQLAAIFSKFKNPLPKIFMDWEQMLKAVDVFDYGSHGVTHTDFDEMGEGELLGELRESKKEIEQKLRQNVTALSYPHGKYSELSVELAKKAGFQTAVTTRKGVNKNPDLLCLKRISVDPDDDMIIFRLKLGIYYPLSVAIKKFI